MADKNRDNISEDIQDPSETKRMDTKIETSRQPEPAEGMTGRIEEETVTSETREYSDKKK